MKGRAATGGVADLTRERVRERYGRIAAGRGCCSSVGSSAGCCGASGSSSCCGDSAAAAGTGYRPEELGSLPKGADLGLGCGNPTALLALRTGQVVLDLGSGGGVDCFLASRKVGAKGRVIGIDMTPEMVARARENARRGGYGNVEFRLGEIEHLPVADRSVDVVISNCVINLAPDKSAVYAEAFRVLRPGGVFAVSDVVATRPIAKKDRENPELWSSCSSGAIAVPRLKALLHRAGFGEIQVDVRGAGDAPSSLSGQASLGVFPADIRAIRPEA
jgi:arsenite methyltransferase